MPTKLLSAVAALLVTSIAPQAAAGQTNPAAVRAQTFEIVWERVNEKFYDPAFNGVDWRAVRERYRPRVEALTADAELYPLLDEMLHELKVSHFAIIPPGAPVREESSPADDPSFGGEAGMTVRMIEGRPTITELDPKGPAAAAGLRSGYVVTRIGAHDLAKTVERANTRSDRPAMRAFLVRRTAETFLGGMPGSKVEIAYLDAEDKPGVATVVRREAVGRPVTFGAMPTVLARVEARRFEDGVGYVKFNIWMLQLLGELRSAIASFRGAPGVIVDLRGNPGGLGAMAPALASLFAERQATLGTMKMRDAEMNFVVFPQKDAFTGPVVILTDEGSASTSEVLAGGMQENGRATIVGGQTLGAVLPSVFETLPNGAVFQYAVADFKTPKGVLLEGRGVTPDVLVTPSRADYLQGRDPVLEAAVRRIAAARSAQSPAQ